MAYDTAVATRRAVLATILFIFLISGSVSVLGSPMRGSCLYDKYFSVCLENNNIFPGGGSGGINYWEPSGGWLRPNTTTAGTSNVQANNYECVYDLALTSAYSDFGIGTVNPNNGAFQAHADGSFKGGGPVGGPWNFDVYSNGNTTIGANLTATNYFSGDGSQGITDDSSYWLCTSVNCDDTCQVEIKDGLITGCV